MTNVIASVGDKVSYREFEVQVDNIAFCKTVDDMQSPPLTATEGEIHYYISATEFDSQWVPASECDLRDETGIDTFFGQDIRSPHLTELGYNMVSWMDGLHEHTDNAKLPAIVSMLMAIQYDKEGQYGSSWCGKGEYRGIMANIDRKYDRLDKMTQSEIEGSILTLHEMEELLKIKEGNPSVVNTSTTGESKIDAIADLANYCLLYLTYVKEKYPRVFQIWVSRNVPAYLADKIPFI